MKNFKIKLTIISALFLSLILFNSCEKDDNNLIEQSNEFAKFKSVFPNLASKINYSNIQKTNSISSAKSENNVDGVTFPVIENNTIIGRYFGTKDEKAAVYIDFTNYQNEITIYNVNNPVEFSVIKMELDSKTGNYTPILSEYNKNGWCITACTIASIAMALSDGPLPFMDYLAVVHQIACLADCVTE